MNCDKIMTNHPRKSLKLCKRRRGSRRDPSGVIVTEFAICAPILFFFFFAALEFSRVNMIRQSVENAVYEGCRRGIVPGATADDCRASARTVLNSISANVATINITPNPITSDTTAVTVQISVPLNSNSWVAPFFFADKSIVSSMTMRRERFGTSSVP
jgi:Flp pilus assembly protein TadG